MSTGSEPIEVLDPAPALPALVGTGFQDLELVVAHSEASLEGVREWAEGLRLRSVSGPNSATDFEPLESIAVASVPRGMKPERVAGAAALPALNRCTLARVTLRPGRPLKPTAPRSAQVYDLMRGEQVVRRRCVAAVRDRFARAGRLRVAFASDLHLASRWDGLESILERRAPDLAGRFVNPNRQLQRLIEQVNALADRGEVDVLVLGGDLVDYVYRAGRRDVGHRAADSNLPLLLDLVQPLRVPLFAIPGNHDYRLYPWRPHLYGLASLGVPRDRLAALRDEEDLGGSSRLRVSDREALWTGESAGRPELEHHLRLLSPATDCAVNFGELRFVLLSTGRDVLPRWRFVARGRRRLLVGALAHSWQHPDSEGLDSAQLDALERWLVEGPTAVFHHAPLLHASNGVAVETRIRGLAADPRDLPARRRFEWRLQRAGLRQGVLFEDPGRLARVLVSGGHVATFSGHVHRAQAVQLGRGRLDVRSTSIEQAPHESAVSLLGAPALGQRAAHGGDCAPGFLLAEFRDGALASVERRLVG